MNPAQQLLAQGYHCSEAVLKAVCQELGIENELIPRIAGALGGGMAGTGEVCGAVSSALMCISIKHGREEPSQSDDEAYVLARRFLRRFRNEMGSIRCRELTGIDLTTREGVKQFRTSDVPLRVCLPAAGLAYRLVLELLQGPRHESAGGEREVGRAGVQGVEPPLPGA